MVKTLFATAAVFAVASLTSVDAHGAMSLPKPNSAINNSPSGTVDGPSIMPPGAGDSYGQGPDTNTAAFHKAFKAQSKFKSVRDIVYAGFKPDGASTKECGQSAATGPAQALPDFVEYNGNGFDSSHEGPCEVWCDDTRVFYEENCSKKYTTKPAKLPYDKSKCAGAKRLQSFWLALHVPAWQAYISCATLGGSGGGAASTPAAGGAASEATTDSNAGGNAASNSGGNAGGSAAAGGNASGNAAAGGNASGNAAAGGNAGGNAAAGGNAGGNAAAGGAAAGGNNNNNNAGGNNSNNNNNGGNNGGNNNNNNGRPNGQNNGGNNNNNNNRNTNNGGNNNNNNRNNNNNGGNNNNNNNGGRSWNFGNLAGKRTLRAE